MGNCVKIDQTQFKAGNVHNIAGYKIREVQVLAEGGYGYIWKVQDINSGKYYALKKIICQTPESKRNFETEIQTIQFIGDARNIIKLLGVHRIQKQDYQEGLILMQLAKKTVFDLLVETKEKPLSQKQIVRLLKEISQGLKHMHDKGVTHRDIKIENVLLNYQNVPKLCDFGSASRINIDLSKVSKNQMYAYQQIFQKNTTMMYRPPQMIDLYLKYKVNQKVDIWMLGCIVFLLNFYVHPFQEMGKLAIINANFKIPQNTRVSDKMKDFIRHLLTPNPQYRPDVNQVLSILQKWDVIKNINLNEVAMTIKSNEKSMHDGEYDNYQAEFHKKKQISSENRKKQIEEGSWNEYQ